MKRLFAFALAALLAVLAAPQPARAAEDAPETKAGGAALMEAGSMRLLAGTNEHERLPMASTTTVSYTHLTLPTTAGV